MLPFVTVATSLTNRVLNRKKGDDAKDMKSLLKSKLNPGDPVLMRDAGYYLSDSQAAVAPSEMFETGEIAPTGDAAPVRWRQYRWSEPRTLRECSWQAVTWRLYENGLIAFQAEMTNASGGLDIGDTQGHRLELVTTDGWMVGAWRAEFFVRRNNAVRHFAGYFEESHRLLSLHFDELAEVQLGMWFRGSGGHQRNASKEA